MADKEKWWAWEGGALTYVGEHEEFDGADGAAHEAGLTPFWIFSQGALIQLRDGIAKALEPEPEAGSAT